MPASCNTATCSNFPSSHTPLATNTAKRCANFNLEKDITMNILSAIFPKAKKITSEAIAAEITRAEADLAATHSKLASVFDGLAIMSDEQHADAEQKATTLRRYGERLQARIDALRSEREAALAAEADAAKVAAEMAHQKRVEAARHAVEIEGADLLRAYETAAAQIAATLARIAEINSEAEECQVPSVDQVHRSTPGTDAVDHRERRKCWVYRFPGSPADTDKTSYLYEAPHEEVREATVGDDGKAIPVGPAIHRFYGREIYIKPTLEEREIVVRQTRARPRSYAPSLDQVQLPGAWAGQPYIWPRQS